MLRREIQIALEAAARISPHRQFVIAGSLSVLGFKEVPPEMMSMSIDIDFFPLQDPGHVAEIIAALGEDSEFHEINGYYLDPISPELPVLPRGWRERLVEVKLGELYAYFLEVHDTAISKYVRGAENDYRWIDAGYLDGILSFEKIEGLERFFTDYPGDDDRKMVRKGIETHRVAIMPDGTLNEQLLEYLRSPVVNNVTRVDDDSGRYFGEIVWIGSDRAVQMIGNGNVVTHKTDFFNSGLHLNRSCTVQYMDGQLTVENLN